MLRPLLAKIAILTGAIAASCGGSSSETPFPLEPNRAELSAAPPRAAPGVRTVNRSRGVDADGGSRAGEGHEPGATETPSTPTWGSEKKSREREEKK